MIRLRLESATDILDLDGVAKNDSGMQALSGLTGLGLPPKEIQWLEGAGNGARPRHRRALPRDIDLPLLITGANRVELKASLARLAKVLAGPATLRVIDSDGSEWTTAVEHVGGGDYTYGQDYVGERDFYTVLTLRAGDPFFSSAIPRVQVIANRQDVRGLLAGGGLIKLSVANSQTIGQITLDNTGDAHAFPVWEVQGPGTNFKAISPTGETIHWEGTLAADERLVIDSRNGTVIDGNGVNRYADLAPAPRFWSVPPGVSTAVASLDNVTPSLTTITCTWRPRRWLVI